MGRVSVAWLGKMIVASYVRRRAHDRSLSYEVVRYETFWARECRHEILQHSEICERHQYRVGGRFDSSQSHEGFLKQIILLLCTGLEGIIQNYKADNSSEFED